MSCAGAADSGGSSAPCGPPKLRQPVAAKPAAANTRCSKAARPLLGVDPENDLGLDADLDLDSDDEDEAPAPLPMVVPWELLNSNEFDTALSELSDWVRWLVRLYHYGPDVVPPCWYLHGDLREELGHLHSGWLMTRHPQAAVGAIGLEWDRHRDITMARCKTITSACGCATASTFKEHKEPADRPWPVDYDADLVTYLAAERDRRDASRIAPGSPRSRREGSHDVGGPRTARPASGQTGCCHGADAGTRPGC